MPTPERTSLPAIVAAARELLEERGPAGVTMQAVAARVGVRAPSLYKRVRDRDALLQAVADAETAELARRLEQGDPAALAHAYRRFAHERPHGFRLIFTLDPSREALERAVEPVMRALTPLAGEKHALEAARLFTAWATGFLQMELSGAFHLGGDVDAAFDYGLERILRGIRN